jgi:glycosyltransferase involved in cell wall biosynthesis
VVEARTAVRRGVVCRRQSLGETVIEILYLAWNRLEFTKASFRTLLANTHWRYVSRVIVYDDGSEDGTAEFLEQAGKTLPVEGFEFRQVNFNAPAATMNDYLALTEAETFVKIDNDIALPPTWLKTLVKVADDCPNYDLYGIEAGQNSPPERPPRRGHTAQTARHIGGVGLMRVEAFRRRMPIPASLGKRSRDGFTIWQYRQRPMPCWVVPDLRVVQLDRIPEEPWMSLRAEYVERGWQREWEFYEPNGRYWWEWLDYTPLDWPEELLASGVGG